MVLGLTPSNTLSFDDIVDDLNKALLSLKMMEIKQGLVQTRLRTLKVSLPAITMTFLSVMLQTIFLTVKKAMTPLEVETALILLSTKVI